MIMQKVKIELTAIMSINKVRLVKTFRKRTELLRAIIAPKDFGSIV
jgi:hypothetical protein